MASNNTDVLHILTKSSAREHPPHTVDMCSRRRFKECKEYKPDKDFKTFKSSCGLYKNPMWSIQKSKSAVSSSADGRKFVNEGSETRNAMEHGKTNNPVRPKALNFNS